MSLYFFCKKMQLSQPPVLFLFAFIGKIFAAIVTMPVLFFVILLASAKKSTPQPPEQTERPKDNPPKPPLAVFFLFTKVLCNKDTSIFSAFRTFHNFLLKLKFCAAVGAELCARLNGMITLGAGISSALFRSAIGAELCAGTQFRTAT